jgi:hypothetical protein
MAAPRFHLTMAALLLAAHLAAAAAPAPPAGYSWTAGTTRFLASTVTREGTRTEARLGDVTAMSYDETTGDVVFVEGRNSIRRLSPLGRVNTFVGPTDGLAGSQDGIGILAGMKGVYYAWVNNNGHTFFTEYGGHRVRQVTTGGSVSLVAGVYGQSGLLNAGSSSEFNNPMGMFQRGTELYVCDMTNHRVRKISVSLSISVSDWGGSGYGFVNGPLSTARFNYPKDIAMDSFDRFFICDGGNGLVRKVVGSTVSTFATIAGNPVVKVDVANTVFMPQYNAGSGSIVYMQPSGAGGMAAHLTGLNGPRAFAANGANIWVSEMGSAPPPTGSTKDRRAKTLAGGPRTIRAYGAVAATATFPQSPLAPTITGFVGLYNAAGSVEGTAAVARWTQPGDVAYDAVTGDALVADSGDHRVSRVTPRLRKGWFAGTGELSPYTNGLTTLAVFNQPVGVTTGSSGVTYVSECGGCRLRAITGGGTVTLLAGSGAWAYAEGTYTSARFTCPERIAWGVVGGIATVYVTVKLENRVRSVVVSTKTSTTVAGTGLPGFTDGPTSLVNQPQGVAVDGAGVVYFGDGGNFAIRKIVSGVTTTFAGTGASGNIEGQGVIAAIGATASLAIDESGHVLMADKTNGKVRMFDAANAVGKVVYTVMCNGVAAAGTGAKRFLAEHTNKRVLVYAGALPVVNPSPGFPVLDALTWMAGSTTTNGVADGTGPVALFSGTFDIAVDTVNGGAIVVDFTANRARRLSVWGRANTLAGDGTRATADGITIAASLNGPLGVAVDAGGDAFTCDSAGFRIRKITTAGAVTKFAGSGVSGHTEGSGATAQFMYPTNVAVHNTKLYVTDNTGHRLRKVTSTGTVSTAAGDGSTGFTDGPRATLNSPRGIAIDATGTIYFGDNANFAVRKLVAGTVTTFSGTGARGDVLGTGVTAAHDAIRSLSVDGNGFLWAADQPNSKLRLWDTSNGAGIPVAVTVSANFYGVAVNADSSHVYLSDYKTVRLFGGVLAEVTASPAAPTFPAPTAVFGSCGAGGAWADGYDAAARFDDPHHGSFDATTGELVVADGAARRVRRLTASAKTTTFAGSGLDADTNGMTLAAAFRSPTGVAVDSSGMTFVADSGSHKVRKISTGGTVSTRAGTTQGYNVGGAWADVKFNFPASLCVVGTDVFVGDRANYVVRKVDASATVAKYAGTAGVVGFTDGPIATFALIEGTAADGAGVLYVTDANHAVRKVALDGSVSTLAGTGAPGTAMGVGVNCAFNSPFHVAVDDAGYVYVPDRGNNQLMRIDPAGVVVQLLSGLNGPRGASLGRRGAVVYVFDSGDNCVKSYGLEPPTRTPTRTPPITPSVELPVTPTIPMTDTPTTTAVPTSAVPATTAMPSSAAPSTTAVPSTSAAATTAAAAAAASTAVPTTTTTTTAATSSAVPATVAPPPTSDAPASTAAPPVEVSASLEAEQQDVRSRDGAAVAMEVVLGADAAEGLSVASVAAVGGASVLGSPAMANKAANIARIAASVRCGFDDSALQTSAIAVFIVAPIGGTKFRYLIGGVAVIFGFIAVLVAASALLHRFAPAHLTVRRAQVKLWHFIISYMLPTAEGFITTIFFHGEDAGDIAFAAIAGAVTLAAHGGALYALLQHLPTGKTSKFDSPEEQAGDRRLYPVYMFADGCLDARSLVLRVFFLEDVVASGLMAIVASVMPEGASCTLMAVLILVIAAAHAGYVIFLRPYDDKVENGFAIVVAVGQIVLASVVVWATTDPSNDAALLTVGIVTVALVITFFVQALVLAAVWLWERLRRGKREGDAKGNGVLVVPLLDDAAVLDAAAKDGAMVPDSDAAAAPDPFVVAVAEAPKESQPDPFAVPPPAPLQPPAAPPARKLDVFVPPSFAVDSVLANMTTRGSAAQQAAASAATNDDDSSDLDDDLL